MKSTDDRSLQSVVIASDAATGNVTTIPATQATSGNGRASLKLGFPPETFISRSAGGNPPYGADTNGLFKLLSQAIQSLQAGYVGQFDSTFATAIGGYPSGAIVCGSTAGTFWVSTADSNLTTPGADGASWQSLFNGLATESWANDTFVGKAEGDQDYSPLQAGVNKTSGEIWLSYTNSSGTVEYAFAQVAGDYALQTALAEEISRAEAAETALSDDKVDRAGDTMTGALILSAENSISGLYWGAQLYSTIKNQSGGSSTGDYSFGLWAQQLPGTYTAGILSLNGYQGRKDFRFNEDGNIFTPLGTVALTSQLPTSGTLTGTGSVITGYWTKTAGILRQTFTIEVSPDSDGNATVTFPISFSEVPTVQATGSVELQQVHTGGVANQSTSTSLKVTTTQAPLHFWTGANTSSVTPSIVTITAEGPA